MTIRLRLQMISDLCRATGSPTLLALPCASYELYLWRIRVSLCRLALSAPVFAFLCGCTSSPQPGEQQEVEKLRSQLRAAQHESQVRARADIEYFHVQNTECPIHHLHDAPMRVIRVPIVYGLILSTRPEPTIEVRHFQFPYARAFVFGGCLVSPDSPQHAKIYQCGECLRAEKAWYAAHPKTK